MMSPSCFAPSWIVLISSALVIMRLNSGIGLSAEILARLEEVPRIASMLRPERGLTTSRFRRLPVSLGGTVWKY